MQQNQSEVAQLLESIRAEYVAGQRALHAPAMVGSHEFISARMGNMFSRQMELAGIVGDDRANHMVAKAIDRISEDDLIVHVEDSLRNGDFK